MVAVRKRTRTHSVVLVGRPNVGKSTLFNRVCGSRRAIVTPVAGHNPRRDSGIDRVAGRAVELVDTGRALRGKHGPAAGACFGAGAWRRSTWLT